MIILKLKTIKKSVAMFTYNCSLLPEGFKWRLKMYNLKPAVSVKELHYLYGDRGTLQKYIPEQKEKL